MSAVPYIGAKISLISKSEIRYEGILYSIDLKESTVALEKVKTFGTEGRRKGVNEIPSSDNVFDYIVFRGTDIKDLQICESPASQQRPPPMNPYSDPRMQSYGYNPPNMPYPPHPAMAGYNYPSNSNPFMVPPGYPPYWQSPSFPPGGMAPPNKINSTASNKASDNAPQQKPAPTEKAHSHIEPTSSHNASDIKSVSLEKKLSELIVSENADKKPEKVYQRHEKSNDDAPSRKPEQQHRERKDNRHPRSHKIDVPKTEYDFESANAKFNKEEVVEELKDNLSHKFYDKKSSFFDSISCESNVESSSRTFKSSEERKLNMETFGRATSYHRRGGRGRGRGGQKHSNDRRNNGSHNPTQSNGNESNRKKQETN